MARLLIIEDSPLMQKVIKHLATSELSCKFDLASTMAEAKKFIEQSKYFLALADLNLPDAPNGEVIDEVLAAGITTIVLTASMDDRKRHAMLDKGVLDYIYKENRDSYVSAIKLANQLLHNKHTTVLLADDSITLRTHICKQLQRLLFNVIEVENGLQALAALEQHPQIELLITDFNMPEMDGIELIRKIRQTRSRDTFPIIGLSSSSDPTLSARFIKFGANDFLITPFIHEEFQWRILRTMEQISLFKKITDTANKDYLTKLYNRRYFYTHSRQLFKKAVADDTELVIALIDIDLFKKINDTYGHDSGDAVLVQLSAILQSIFKGFIVARFGGEEFIVIIDKIAIDSCAKYFELFREKIENTRFTIPDGELSVTVSLGVAWHKPGSLQCFINKADVALYQAKESGRNRIVYDAE